MLQQHQDTAQYEQNGQIHVQITSPQADQHDYTEAIEILASTIRGEVILPGNPAYEAERKVWNGSFDGYPAAIVRCADAEDVKVAVNRPLAKVVAGVLWGLNKGDRYPLFINFAYLIG